MEDKKTTDTWNLYEIGKQYNRLNNLYEDGEDNYNYYHGRQWEGLKRPKSSQEPIVLNIVKPIVKYKVNVVNQNSYQIIFNPNTYSTMEELEQLRSATKGLTQFVNKMWEKSQSGKTVRSIVKTACINSEGIIYFYNEDDMIYSEQVDKNNIYYGNENEEDIQNQPYILATFRKTVKEVREKAKKYRESGYNHLTDEEINGIVSDMDYNEQQGKDKMLMEVSPMCLVIKKFEKREDGKIYVSESTKTCDIIEPQSTDCELYPFAHYLWEEEKGYARGVSEVKSLIENQREINKTATRRAIAVKIGAYPKLVADTEHVTNPEALESVGSTIKLQSMRADDVKKVVSYLNPATMSPDAYNLQQDLISQTRELAGAGDTATGTIDPEKASGKAILAVQQASQQPLNEQVENYKYFLEDCARIVFEMIKVYFVDGLTLYASEDTVNDLGQTESLETPFKISQADLDKIDINLKIDITPTSPYDKYAQEMSLENLLLKGLINLEEYTEALPEDSTMPKPSLESIIKKRKEARKQIAMMQEQMNAIDSAIKQEMIAQGGDVDAMSQLQAGNVGGEGTEQLSVPQMQEVQ
jgi:hypothetical protein